jgi:hypothetical protein
VIGYQGLVRSLLLLILVWGTLKLMISETVMLGILIQMVFDYGLAAFHVSSLDVIRLSVCSFFA